MQRRSFAVSVLAGASILATGCGGGGGDGGGAVTPDPAPGPVPSPAPVPVAYAYLAMPASAGVAMYGVLADGTLDAIGTAPAAAGTSCVAVHASGRFAYAVNTDARTITIYERDQTTGSLRLKDLPAVQVPQFSTDLRFDPAGEIAYVMGGGGVGVYSVNPETGGLSLERFNMTNAFCFDVHPSKPFVFVVSDMGRLTSYEVDAHVLGEVNFALPGNAAVPADVVVAPSGGFLYVTSYTRDLAIHGIDQDTGGVSSEVLFAMEFGGGPIVLHPSGSFAYAAGFSGNEDEGSHGVFVFEIESGTGMLTQRAFHPWNAASRSLAISPEGRFLYATHHGSSTISGFPIHETTGQLMSPGVSIDVGGNPAGICLVETVG